VSDHSHVGQVSGIYQGAPYFPTDNIAQQLARYARYSVTTVVALGNNGLLFARVRADHAGRIGGADLFGVAQGIGIPDGAPPQAMLEVGPDQLFRPATAQAAALMRLRDRGTLARGQRADMLMVRGAPDRVIGAVRDIVMVWAAGRGQPDR